MTLTERGLDCVREARQCLERASRRLLWIAICFKKEQKDRNARFERMCDFDSYLRRMQWHYGDTAERLYPWHPEDE